MILKLFGLQKKLDALFDAGWVSPGFVCSRGFQYEAWAASVAEAMPL
jgi:hypothetical protein